MSITLTRHYRLTGYLLGLALAMVSIVPFQAKADTNNITRPVDPLEYAAGMELKLSTRATVAIFPGAMTSATQVSFGLNPAPMPTLPSGRRIIGEVYAFTLSGQAAWVGGVVRPSVVSLPFGPVSTWQKSIYMYDSAMKKWTKLATKYYLGRNIGVAEAKSLSAIYMVMEDRRTQEGIASWYCKNHCSSRYPVLHGTSNDFPVGSMVTVTSLENKKSVQVKIVSRWGQPAGRVVDLSYAAFSKIKGTNGGLTRVKVTGQPSVTSSPPKPISTTTYVPTPWPTPVPDAAPALSVTKNDSEPYPGSSVAAYAVIDEGSGKILAEKMATTPRAIASITKLMTAAVFLDTKTDMAKKVTLKVGDKAICVCSGLTLGEQMSAKDALSVMLVASANDAANMLVRLTGLTKDQFIARMNAKAQTYGLTQTKYFDPSGLDERNTSSALDLSRLSSRIFRDYPLIRDISALPSYTFKPLNTSPLHRVVTADKLLINGMMPSNLVFAGGKTGYIGIASGLNFTVRFGLPNGARVIVTILGAEKGTTIHYTDALALADWVRNHYTWR